MVLVSLLGGAHRRSSLPLCLCRVISLPRMPFGSFVILRLTSDLTRHGHLPISISCWSEPNFVPAYNESGRGADGRIIPAGPFGNVSAIKSLSAYVEPPPPSTHTNTTHPPTHPPTQRSRSRSSFGLRQNLCDTSYIRSKGMRFGIYGAAGQTTCASRVGSLYHERADAEFFAELGVE
jgi:hypothetical protein